MNSTRTAALLITGTVCAAVVTAAGTTVHAETIIGVCLARHTPKVEIEGIDIGVGRPCHPKQAVREASVAPRGLLRRPRRSWRSRHLFRDRRAGRRYTRVEPQPVVRSDHPLGLNVWITVVEPTRVVGSALTPDASPATNFGLFSPTGAFLGLVGPGGLLIGDGVLPGQDGGLLFGNGADGAEDQDGGDGGLLYGNGGNGGHGGFSQKPGGNGGNSGSSSATAATAATAPTPCCGMTTAALISPATAGGNGGNRWRSSATAETAARAATHTTAILGRCGRQRRGRRQRRPWRSVDRQRRRQGGAAGSARSHATARRWRNEGANTVGGDGGDGGNAPRRRRHGR